MLKHLYLITLLLTAPLFACDQTNNSSETKVTPLLQQYPSNNLEELTKQLKQGLPKEDVEKILGLPDYSPIDGLFYYSSKGSASFASRPILKSSLGLIFPVTVMMLLEFSRIPSR